MTDEGHGSAVLTADDGNSIRSLLARLYDAGARGDGDGYAACFADKSDHITFNGIHLHGRAENAELHGGLINAEEGVTVGQQFKLNRYQADGMPAALILP